MLVLTRKVNESIRIAEGITITVVRIEGKTVRLGIEAPRTVRVLRGELPVHAELPVVDQPTLGGTLQTVAS